MPLVGSPPDQNIASIEPSFIPSTVLPSSVRCAWMSLAGSSPRRLQHPVGDHLGAGIRRSGGHPLAAHVGDRVDAGVGPRDDLRVVGVQPGQRRDRLRPVERLLALRRVGGGVGEREGDLVRTRHQLLDVLQRRRRLGGGGLQLSAAALADRFGVGAAEAVVDARWCFRSRCSGGRRSRRCTSSAPGGFAAVTTSLSPAPGQHQQHYAGNHRQCDPPHVIMIARTARFHTWFTGRITI